MSEQQAINIARETLSNHAISSNSPLISSSDGYIEIVKNNESGECIAIRDVLVWLIRFAKPRGWIEFAVAQEGLEIVRIEKSR